MTEVELAATLGTLRIALTTTGRLVLTQTQRSGHVVSIQLEPHELDAFVEAVVTVAGP